MSNPGWIAQVAMKDGAVGTAEVIDANITTAKLADNAVTAAKLASGAGQAGYYGQLNVALYGYCYYG